MNPIFPLNPVALQVGQLTIHWYGVLYLIGFTLAYRDCLKRRSASREPYSETQILDLFSQAALGLILGGRLFYLLVYDSNHFWRHPWEAFYIWLPGRSFHGGLLGVMAAVLFHVRQTRHSFWRTLDFIAPSVPLGLLCGRVGNFINGELWGRVTLLPWALVFPNGGPLPRHPSQLYEALGEGLLLYFILKARSLQVDAPGFMTGAFSFFYGIIRFVIEFYREPDRHLNFIALDCLTMGQLLSLPMIVVGLYLMRRSHASLS